MNGWQDSIWEPLTLIVCQSRSETLKSYLQNKPDYVVCIGCPVTFDLLGYLESPVSPSYCCNMQGFGYAVYEGYKKTVALLLL